MSDLGRALADKFIDALAQLFLFGVLVGVGVGAGVVWLILR
jgi:hypothetical protein